jgi:hypothetical protein
MSEATPGTPAAALLAELAHLRACADAIPVNPGAFDLEVLMPRYAAAVAAVERVLKEHGPDRADPAWCGGCGFSYPCATVRAITAALTGTQLSEDGEHG